jgi:hypothetical protein
VSPNTSLGETEKAGEKPDYRVAKIKVSKDKTTLIDNQFLTLNGIPKETFSPVLMDYAETVASTDGLRTGSVKSTSGLLQRPRK